MSVAQGGVTSCSGWVQHLTRDYGWPMEGFVVASSIRTRSYFRQNWGLFASLCAAYRELKLSMSACEYAAPMTFLLCDELDVFEVVRQNGDADLFAYSQQAIVYHVMLYIRRTICTWQSKLLATPDAMTLAAVARTRTDLDHLLGHWLANGVHQMTVLKHKPAAAAVAASS